MINETASLKRLFLLQTTQFVVCLLRLSVDKASPLKIVWGRSPRKTSYC